MNGLISLVDYGLANYQNGFGPHIDKPPEISEFSSIVGVRGWLVRFCAGRGWGANRAVAYRSNSTRLGDYFRIDVSDVRCLFVPFFLRMPTPLCLLFLPK